MKDTEVIDLAGELLAKDSHNIYICGPSYGDNHLRVYAPTGACYANCQLGAEQKSVC